MQKTITVNGHRIKLVVRRRNGGFIRGVATDNKGHKLIIPGLYGPTLQDAMDTLFVDFMKKLFSDLLTDNGSTTS